MKLRWSTLHIAVLAVTAVAVGQPTVASAAPRQAPSRPVRWLAAGDSYSSGQGLPNASGECKQAQPGSGSRVYATVAAQKLGASFVRPNDLDLVACGGATIRDALKNVGAHPAQWTADAGRYDLVTFTLGGNDIRFSAVIMQCTGMQQLLGNFATVGAVGAATTAQGQRLPSDPGHYCPQETIIRQRIDELATAYADFLKTVAENILVRGGNIVVLGYPELIEDPNQWTGLPQAVDICQTIGRADANELRGLGGYLNATIGNAATQADGKWNGVHVSFLDVNSGGGLGIARSDARLFEPSTGTRHNLCSADSWINGFTSVGNGVGSFHPKQQAHDTQGSLLADVLPRLDWSQTRGPTTTPAPTGSGPVGGGPASGGGGPAGPLQFSIEGSCTNTGGTLRGASSGFTPGGRFTVSATRPDGSPYPLGGLGGGSVHSNGSVTWSWPCAGNPPGVYHTTLVDSATGRSTGPVAFTIGTAPPLDSHPVFTVMNTSETSPDGVWFRNSPHTADTDRVTGHGVYAGNQVRLDCYGWGDVVAPYNNSLWYRASNLTRPTTPNGGANTGWLNAHYIDDGQKANVVDTGVPAC
ncbi:GDSL-type esterase/lipase family protein [Dactylosporangium sp. CA-139066]|uniref:GDSL-type esterase/lipase family protein n=1 Tax=Dactylosporangium sp. CA-139066 TaxID=3239930 RepID=UPI003D8E7ACC